jgi:hypothetical protein
MYGPDKRTMEFGGNHPAGRSGAGRRAASSLGRSSQSTGGRVVDSAHGCALAGPAATIRAVPNDAPPLPSVATLRAPLQNRPSLFLALQLPPAGGPLRVSCGEFSGLNPSGCGSYTPQTFMRWVVNDSAMDDLLTKHSSLLCRFYNLRRLPDLNNLGIEYSEDYFRQLKHKLRAVRLFKTVELRPWPSPSATWFHLWPADKELPGIALVASRIAPFFYTEWLRRESWDQFLDFELPTAKDIIESRVYRRAKAARKNPIPNEAKQLNDKVLAIVSAGGFIHLSSGTLKRPLLGKSIPRFLRKRHISFFYFHSISPA